MWLLGAATGAIFTEVHRIGAMKHHASRCPLSSRCVTRLNLRRMYCNLIYNLAEQWGSLEFPFRPLNIGFLVSFSLADQSYLLTIANVYICDLGLLYRARWTSCFYSRVRSIMHHGPLPKSLEASLSRTRRFQKRSLHARYPPCYVYSLHVGCLQGWSLLLNSRRIRFHPQCPRGWSGIMVNFHLLALRTYYNFPETGLECGGFVF